MTCRTAVPQSNLHQALLALGANVGDRYRTLDTAVDLLDGHQHVQADSRSNWHETRPVGCGRDGSTFLNAAAVLRTSLSPPALLDLLLSIEKQLGRERETVWGPRTVDLDLLLYNGLVIDEPTLIVPHPRLAVRSFVLEPSAEIAPEWQHPWIGASLRDIWHNWRHGDQAIGLIGNDDEDLSWLTSIATHAVPALGSDGCTVSLTPLKVDRVRGDVPRLAVATNRELAIRGLPTLVVDREQPEIARRDVAAAIHDAWPDLGGDGPGS